MALIAATLAPHSLLRKSGTTRYATNFRNNVVGKPAARLHWLMDGSRIVPAKDSWLPIFEAGGFGAESIRTVNRKNFLITCFVFCVVLC